MPAIGLSGQIVKLKMERAESVIARSTDGRLEIRCPAYPADCEYVRVVLLEDGEVTERYYWDIGEWTESEAQGAEVMGAILGAVKEVLEYGE